MLPILQSEKKSIRCDLIWVFLISFSSSSYFTEYGVTLVQSPQWWSEGRRELEGIFLFWIFPITSYCATHCTIHYSTALHCLTTQGSVERSVEYSAQCSVEYSAQCSSEYSVEYSVEYNV